MNQHIIWVLSLCFIASVSDGKELFEDASLRHGFELSAVASTKKPLTVSQIFVTHPSFKGPRWRLAQWGTRYSLVTAEEEKLPDGTRSLSNAGKTVLLHPGGLAGEGVTLRVNGGAEYPDRLRRFGEPWPHLLVEQRLRAVACSDWQSLTFHLEFFVEQCIPVRDTAQDPSLHTAQVGVFFTVHNLNKKSADFRDMIWFGLPVYDVRFGISPGHQALDIGKNDATGKFICTLSGDRFYSEPVLPGKWHTLSADLLPLLQDALDASKEHGHLTHSELKDLQFTSFNLGWEVPGSYDCAIRLRRLSLKGEASDEVPGRRR
ncbi:MAG TPA: hypothetical protein PLY90_04100 [Candidatus Hydrogenedentes bacterium]|nr:MAG: hypothetical protein BWY07_01484 [Candidatus Hydrogenedentes bacterium ADurb.Bin170]HNZ48275.1 hypothetical protein [Candidatus Hydrogenedentota bacterium]HQB02458.1 hypothetical protein [Candidatus Hydrogenedentota bacterium]